MTRLVPIAEAGRTFDIPADRQRQGPKAIFDAAWQMVLETHARGPNGGQPLTFQRSVGGFRKVRG